eukprot:TRINITY_DN23915_c0_g1_i1.p1 TRINITY_DN23915_c0_g1~~TRINITY_DN23915_c0_g1_i1.p1  ORF type:complete len:1005 (-),score=65.84 TRINITY_DN23915_c0_g1_i1:321-3335(-)
MVIAWSRCVSVCCATFVIFQKVLIASASDSLADFLHTLHFQLLSADSQLNISLGALGVAHITNLNCSEVGLKGIDTSAEILSPSKNREGDVRLSTSITAFAASCVATWTYDKHSGQASFKVATQSGTMDPFVKFVADLAGRSIHGDDDVRYPFPDKVSRTECSTHFDVNDLRFTGAASWLLDLLADILTSDALKGLLRPLLCQKAQSQAPQVIDNSLLRARQIISPLLQHLPHDLEPPTVAKGSPESSDLTLSRPLAFLHRLLQQGMQSGGLIELIKRVTANTDGLSIAFPNGGMRMVNFTIHSPTDLSLSAFVDSGTVSGPQTIKRMNVVPVSDSTLSVEMGQQSMNVSVDLRAMFGTRAAYVDATDEFSSQISAERRLTESLMERMQLHLAISNLNISAHLGVLLNAAQVQYLSGGSSWSTPECLHDMIMNASAIGIDLRMIVDEFALTTVGHSPHELEAEIDRSVNSILQYLNDPLMRPTVSRLVRLLAAGPARNAMNDHIQRWLSSVPSKECVAKFGVGSYAIFWTAVTLGLLSTLAASISLCVRCRVTGNRLLQYRRWNVSALMLGFASLCFVLGGLLGFPFRAAIRLHNGDNDDPLAGDSLLYLFVLEIQDSLRYMPRFLFLTIMLVYMFGLLRIFAVLLAAKPHCHSRVHSFIRLTSAFGAYDMVLLYFFAVTQITSFYAKVFEFGDAHVDTGAQLNFGLYVHAIGFWFCDAATLFVLPSSLDSRSVKPSVTELPLVAHRRNFRCCKSSAGILSIVALVIALVALICAPFLTLFSHTYAGALQNVLHYQSNTPSRSFTLLGVLAELPSCLLNPFWGYGAFALQLLVIVHVVVAPLSHTALALYINICFCLQTDSWEPGTHTLDAVATRTSTVDLDIEEARRGKMMRLQLALTSLRMIAGADAFALTMFVAIPELGSEMVMLTAQTCSAIQPALDRFEMDCTDVRSRVEIGTFVLFAAGLAARLLTEVCAHAPLREKLLELNHTPIVRPPLETALAEQ